MRGRYQGGSLAGFAIIGVVLALVLIGGLYGLNRYNAEQAQQAAEEGDSTEVATDSDKSTSGSESKPSEDSPKKESSSTSGSNSSSSDEKQSDSSDSSSKEMAAAGSNATATELPATGPVDTFASILGIVALSFATAAYIQSRTQNNR